MFSQGDSKRVSVRIKVESFSFLLILHYSWITPRCQYFGNLILRSNPITFLTERPTHNIPINNPLWTHSNLRRNVYLDSGLFYIYQQYRKPILRPLQPTPSVSRYYSNIINTSIRINRKLQYDSYNFKITYDRLTNSSLKLLHYCHKSIKSFLYMWKLK